VRCSLQSASEHAMGGIPFMFFIKRRRNNDLSASLIMRSVKTSGRYIPTVARNVLDIFNTSEILQIL
jgi:hypothetical protein